MTPFERAKAAIAREIGISDAPIESFALPDGRMVETETLVRAVLQAIREPTHKMQQAAFSRKVSFRSGSGMSDIGQVSVEYEGEPDKGASTLWRAMIDAALEEG